MYKKDNGYIFSASDLSSHLNCHHLTQLNLKEADGLLKKPQYQDRILDLLQQRGQDFESEFLSKLQKEHEKVVIINKDSPEEKAIAYENTLNAMKEGADVIYQARLKLDPWAGWADYLIKKEITPGDTPSIFGNWFYEVLDTKLATETKAGTILQIALYTEMLTNLQGRKPEFMYVKKPDGLESYRVDDYLAYMRFAKTSLQDAVSKRPETYPEPASHCDVCNWWDLCNKQRRADDHLSFVAGISRSNIRELHSHSIDTLANLARSLPKGFKPSRGSLETYQRLNHQARLQEESRINKKPVHEILPRVEGQGFFCLPEPTKWDIYLDLEGDPMVENGGREYMFGWLYRDQYHTEWAETPSDEKIAFEKFIDLAVSIKAKHPGMHIYHFGAYEVSAFKRLMGKYATREDQMDIFLRAGTFIDLHGITKKALRAGVERYSLKDLEKYHQYLRQMDLRELSGFKADYEFLLETEQHASVTKEMKAAIVKYNEDDCRSTISLHKWLENERGLLIGNGEKIPRPEMKDGAASEGITAFQERIKPIYESLTRGLPAEKADRNAEQQAKFIIANMLEWYRREEKSFWWNLYRLTQMDEEDLLEEKEAVAYLKFIKEEDVQRSKLYTYQFPPQELEFQVGKKLVDRNNSACGEIIELNTEKGIIKIKKGKKLFNDHSSPLFMLENFNTKEKGEAIIRLGTYLSERGFSISDLSYNCAKDLLLRNGPRFSKKSTSHENLIDTAIEWAKNLESSILPIQGPPGAGKSYTASHMILALAKKGFKIGVTALSHKVITNLLQSLKKLADEKKQLTSIIQKTSEEEERPWYMAGSTDHMLDLKYQIYAGTPFLWSSEKLKNHVDYLFVDEAGQLSLIDTLAVTHATKNLILLGDPQQLKQPQKGVHPDGTEVSALEHLLDSESTIEENKGLFLDMTYRMHPEICEFDSELFYDSRLNPIQGLENQRLEGIKAFKDSGLYYRLVAHEGNTNSSVEEVLAIETIINDLLSGKVRWTDKNGKSQKLTPEHIKIISPYNAQVTALGNRLPEISIGTVDKFQGQEAPVVIYSMATSSAEEAPRGMEFLYSPNRFNVAVSRAKGIFILVASPGIFQVDCKSPEQIKLANAFCRFLEKAKAI